LPTIGFIIEFWLYMYFAAVLIFNSRKAAGLSV
jgi:hypothetical protein